MKLTTTNGKPVTMTSLELVDFINSQRKEGEAELRHDNFLAKVPQVLGEGDALNFKGNYKDSMNRQKPMYTFPKRESCLIAMSYSYEIQAKVFDRMTQLEEQVLKVGAGRTATLTRNQVAASILLLRSAAEDLKFAPSAVLGGYQRLEAQLGVAGLLPAYAVDASNTSASGSSDVTKAVGELLEQFGVGMSAVAFNRLLLQHGFIEEHERPSSHGVKKFKAVTDLEYGKNLTSPSNPRETQPHWYVSKFPELLELVMPAKLEAVS